MVAALLMTVRPSALSLEAMWCSFSVVTPLQGQGRSPALAELLCRPTGVSVLVDRVEQVEQLLRRLGCEELVDLVGFGEEDGDSAEDVHVAALVAGDAHGKADVDAHPVDRCLVADDLQGRPLDRLLRL